MDFFSGIKYNVQGVFFALKHPGLLWLGLLRFLIPWVNIVLLSFAPIGATLYHIHKNR
jgi:hypothetical protein